MSLNGPIFCYQQRLNIKIIVCYWKLECQWKNDNFQTFVYMVCVCVCIGVLLFLPKLLQNGILQPVFYAWKFPNSLFCMFQPYKVGLTETGEILDRDIPDNQYHTTQKVSSTQ